MLKSGLWVAAVGFLVTLAPRVYWMLVSFNVEWYAEDWYEDVGHTMQVLDVAGTVIVVLGLILAASGVGRAIRGGAGQAPGSYAAPGQPYPAPSGYHPQQQPWAQSPQSPQQWGGQPPNDQGYA